MYSATLGLIILPMATFAMLLATYPTHPTRYAFKE